MPWTSGRALLSLVGITTSFGCFVADWNETHIYNPRWLPHAKFHNAQTMSMGLLLGFCTLYYTHRPNTTLANNGSNGTETGEEKARFQLRDLNTAALLASLYWVTQLMAWFYPGVAAVDPPGDPTSFPQLYISTFLLTVTAAGWSLERTRINAMH